MIITSGQVYRNKKNKKILKLRGILKDKNVAICRLEGVALEVRLHLDDLIEQYELVDFKDGTDGNNFVLAFDRKTLEGVAEALQFTDHHIKRTLKSDEYGGSRVLKDIERMLVTVDLDNDQNPTL